MVVAGGQDTDSYCFYSYWIEAGNLFQNGYEFRCHDHYGILFVSDCMALFESVFEFSAPKSDFCVLRAGEAGYWVKSVFMDRD